MSRIPEYKPPSKPVKVSIIILVPRAHRNVFNPDSAYGCVIAYTFMTNSKMSVVQKSSGGLIHNSTSKRGTPLKFSFYVFKKHFRNSRWPPCAITTYPVLLSQLLFVIEPWFQVIGDQPERFAARFSLSAYNHSESRKNWIFISLASRPSL